MHDNGQWYIGSTFENIDCRRHSHYYMAHAKSEKPKNKFHQALLSTAESEWTWGVHEEFENISQQQLWQHETDYQMAFDCIDNGFNSKTALRVATRKYKQDAEKKKKAHAQWYGAHREEHNAKRRAHHHANKEEANARRREYTRTHKAETKATKAAYYQRNKEEINAKKKAFYDANKDELNERRRARNALKAGLTTPTT